MTAFFSRKKTLLVGFLLLLSFIVVGKWGKQIALEAQQALSTLPSFRIGKKGTWSNTGGLVSMSTMEEPALSLTSWEVSGNLDVTVYRANESALLNYLQHDSEGKQLNAQVNVSQFEEIASLTVNIQKDNYEGDRLDLPLSGAGIWYVSFSSSEVESGVFVIRSKNGLVIEESKDEYIFWAQQFENLRKLGAGTVTVYDMEGGTSALSETTVNADGLANLPFSARADLAILREGDDIAIAPINLQYLNVGYNYQRFSYSPDVEHFVFTDRPLYLPGDTVFFKGILRDDDDARYTPSGGFARAIIYSVWDRDQRIFDQQIPLNSNGAIDGDFTLPDNLPTGEYSLLIAKSTEDLDEWGSGKTVQFQVEYFRKPEYTLYTDSLSTQAVAGDSITFSIRGEYFSGQPLSDIAVPYDVKLSKAYDSESLRYAQQRRESDTFYGYNGASMKKDQVVLDVTGNAEVTVDTSPLSISDRRLSVITLEATYTDSSGNPVQDAKSILLYSGEYSLYRADSNYSGNVNEEYVLDLQALTNGDYEFSSEPIDVSITRSWWEKNESTDKYQRREEVLPSESTVLDASGKARIAFVPSEPGSYTLTATTKDRRGNTITRMFSAWIRSSQYSYFSEYNSRSEDIQINVDKPEYQPGDTALVTITSEFPQRDILLSVERERVGRYQVVSLSNTNTTIELPIIDEDMPNTFVRATSFINHDLRTVMDEISVPATAKQMTVSLEADRQMYGPGQTAIVDVTTTDLDGNPVSAEVTVWSVDKALFELAGSNLGDIFRTFWQERYNRTVRGHSLEGILVQDAEGGGGCFVADTQILMADGTTKNIQDISAGDKIMTRADEASSELVAARVVSTHETLEEGYLVINGSLKVTPNHIVYASDAWREAGSLNVGDTFINSEGQPVSVTSLEWVHVPAPVYNFEVEGYHTYFADGLWVHNQKGGMRSVFKNTAYWNPSVQTDENGKAQVTIALPDNLTTWVVAGVASNQSTQVGQGTTEVIVSKDVVIRPVLPNVLRNNDSLYFSAMGHNFTFSDDTFTATLEVLGAEVESAVQSGIQIAKRSLTQLLWKARVNADATVAIVTAQLTNTAGESDTVQHEIPVLMRGYSLKDVRVEHEPFSMDAYFADSVVPEKSSITIDVSSTKVGMLPSALRYLIDYPYGCVEQTTSRFVPVLLAQDHQELFSSVTEGKDLDEMVEKGIARLDSLQTNGAWGWWKDEPNMFITAYVTEYLVMAQEKGFEVPESMLSELRDFFTYNPTKTIQEKVSATYAQQLLGEPVESISESELKSLAPDMLAYAVMVNYRNGIRNTAENGVDLLISLAMEEGEGVYWESGERLRFGSSTTSTALALRALLLADSSHEFIPRAVHYLSVHKQDRYWSNTFATVQVARALLEYSDDFDELNADYVYDVLVDGKSVISGEVKPGEQLQESVELSANEVPNGSTITVKKEGSGQIYSTVVFDTFYTDSPDTENVPLKVTREYISDRGYKYGISVGDEVTVAITVEGLDNNPYLIIEDQLPAGLVPINENLENEDAGVRRNYYQNVEYTQNGARIAIRNPGSNSKRVTYKARAVVAGAFYAPPVYAEYMYSPEVFGLSEAEELQITYEPRVIRDAKQGIIVSDDSVINLRNVFILIVFIIPFVLLAFYTSKNRILLKEKVSTLTHRAKQPRDE